jgi:hypothetical protein
MNHGEGRYRVLLIGIGDNTEEKRENFCNNISEIYGIPILLLKKIVEHCPTVLKKNLSLKKAEALANTLKSFGAIVSIEEKRDSSAVSVEFQQLVPPRVALESAYLRRTEGGTWNVIGRVRNISEEGLEDTWVLIQLFDDFEEFLIFEEIPMPINPLPPGEASPFRVILEGDLPIKRVSIAFKNSSGLPIPAVDRRTKKEWVEVKSEIKDEDEYFPSSSLLASERSKETQPIDATQPPQEISQPSGIGFPSITIEEDLEGGGEGVKRGFDDNPVSTEEPVPPEMVSGPVDKSFDFTFSIQTENERHGKQEGEIFLDRVPPQTVILPISEKATDSPDLGSLPSNRENIFPEARFDVSIFDEATKLLEEISVDTGKRKTEEPPSFSWMDNFRNSIETYYQKNQDLFSSWFGAFRKKEGFVHSLHSLLTILAHARFNQKNHSEKALENTQRVFKLLLQPNLPPDEIPLLEGTPFFSGDQWRELFLRALPKLHQVANNILEKKRWKASDLERLIQIIPHMGDKNSRMAIRCIHELIPEAVEIDFSETSVSVGESLYRVGSRLGVVDPHFDYYRGKNSIGDLKIQTFAKTAYPQNPMKIEDPMTWVGMMKEEGGGGYCLPIQPRCEGCLFETFCPKLQVDYNPSEKGMGGP